METCKETRVFNVNEKEIQGSVLIHRVYDTIFTLYLTSSYQTEIKYENIKHNFTHTHTQRHTHTHTDTDTHIHTHPEQKSSKSTIFQRKTTNNLIKTLLQCNVLIYLHSQNSQRVT